jgi:GTP cyclohydrolase I
MNIHTPEIDRLPTREEAEAALALLRQWAGKSSDEDIAGWIRHWAGWCRGRAIRRCRASTLRIPPDAAYRATMPDLQNGPASLIRGAKARIQHVGISNFRLPIRFATRDGGRWCWKPA